MPEASSSIGLLGGAAALLSSTSVAWALGIGAVDNQTVLGAPLRMAIPVQGSAGERNPAPECVKAQVKAGDDPVAPRSVHTRIEAGNNGIYRVHVSTDVRIQEPVVTVMLSLGCESAFQREFVVFVDPPAAPVVPPVVTAMAPTPPEVPQSAVRSIGEGTPTPITTTPVARSSVPSSSALPASGGRQKPRPVADSVAAAKPAPARSAGPRLSLEPATVLAVPPVAVASAPEVAPAAAAAAASSAWPSHEEVAMAHQEALLNQLEDLLKQATADSQAVQASVNTMHAKLRNAEEALRQERERSREQPLIVWVLSGLVGLLALALIAVLLRQRRRPTPFFHRSGLLDQAAAEASPHLPVLDSMPSQLQVVSPEVIEEHRVSLASPVVMAKADPQPEALPAATPREMAVAEVVDLEQQVDFFVALGQDQEAIDLLSGHMNTSHNPLPYLKLFDIHRRRGDRMAYEQLRLRFHRRFNARVPEWNVPMGAGMALEDYPAVQQSLEAHWVDPSSAVKLLESLLFRREGQGASFDLAAFRDLMMLHAVARDLATPAAGAVGASGSRSAEVDLELPLTV